MKKKIAMLLAALMLCSVSVFAAPRTIDLDTMTIAELEELITDATAKINALTPKRAPDPNKSFYDTYEKGSKGDGVKDLQNRLIELNYMTSAADGSYGNMTAQAVTDYQKAEGLKPTGIADSKTQEMIFSLLAKENSNRLLDPSAYEKLNNKAVERDPDVYNSSLDMLTENVIEVLEDEIGTQYRIITIPAVIADYNEIK